MDIGSEIKQIRLKSMLSQKDFAKKLNVSFCTVNRWENKRAVPNYRGLAKLKLFCKKNKINFDINIVNREDD